MESFNPKLIDRLIAYMQEQHGVTLTPEESNEWLRVYADCFLAFSNKKGTAGNAPRPELRQTSARTRGIRAQKSDEVAIHAVPDLINSTLNENETD